MTTTDRAGASGRDLRGFTGAGYDKGRPLPVQALWFAVQHLVFAAWWCPGRLRPALLRAFGARVGERVLIRRGVRVQWPWKLTVGDDVWIGEDVWILTLEDVTIGSDVCLSQGAMLCTGSHRRRSPTFEFDNAPIRVADGAWVAARATVLRGVDVGPGAVVGAGAVAHRDLAAGETVTLAVTHHPASAAVSAPRTAGISELRRRLAEQRPGAADGPAKTGPAGASQESGTQDPGTQESPTQDPGTQDAGTQDAGAQDPRGGAPR